MPKFRFVKPSDVVKVELDEGDWIVLKKYLSHGDEQQISGGMFGSVDMRQITGGSQQIPIDMASYNVRRLLMWLVEWSFQDEKGKVVPISEDAIRQLHPAVAAFIQAEIDKLQEAVDAEKNLLSGIRLPTATST